MTKRILSVVEDLELDAARMGLPDDFADRYAARFTSALDDMKRLERGEHVNTDEDRAVGHYWLRAPKLAPSTDLTATIEGSLQQVADFAGRVKSGDIAGQRGAFEQFLLIGIGGSALGPQLVCDVFIEPGRTPSMNFFDNTDPEGFARTLGQIREAGGLGRTLTIVISKSGGTKETRNGMLIAQRAYEAEGLDFEKHAVAITQRDSKLDRLARGDQDRPAWLDRFEMWDFVGGRTSLFSAVGMLPAALMGFDHVAMLDGARRMDEATRETTIDKNPALLLAGIWHYAAETLGLTNMVVLPYSDRLALLSRYLQQLIMESLGKDGQGLTVFGNKGTTDQHSYIQQLCEGRPDFFALLIHNLIPADTPESQFCIEENITAGDYLAAFGEGTAQALSDGGRPSMRLCVDRIDEATVGAIIALFERAVGFYASMIGINAYHQPGVEAGKRAADAYLTLQQKVVDHVTAHRGQPFTAAQVAATIDSPNDEHKVFDILRRLTKCGRFGLSCAPADERGVESFTVRL